MSVGRGGGGQRDEEEIQRFCTGASEVKTAEGSRGPDGLEFFSTALGHRELVVPYL